MFRGSSTKRAQTTLNALDYSRELRQERWITPNQITQLGLSSEITVVAYDPTQSLVAVGTAGGNIHVFGSPAVTASWTLRPAAVVKHLFFRPNSHYLCSIDAKNVLSVFDLADIDDKQQPVRHGAVTTRSIVTCFAVSHLHSHIFLGMQDGTVDTYDTDRGLLSPYRISNQWFQQEELMRRSGMPGAPSRTEIPPCTDLAINPSDINQILVAYRGGLVLWNVQEKKQIATFELVLPPGAQGGAVSLSDSEAFQERRSSVTCISWRPDGICFAAGFEDGSIAFWSLHDPDKPLMVRTLDADSVHIADMEKLFDMQASQQNFNINREPIFQLSWLAKTKTTVASKIAGLWNGPTEAVDDEAEADLTYLVINGGLKSNEQPGIHVLALPPASIIPSPDLSSEQLAAIVQPSDRIFYPSPAPCHQCIALPTSISAQDAYSLLMIIDSDPDLPQLPFEHANRSVQAFAFRNRAKEASLHYALPAFFGLTGPATVTSYQILNLSYSTLKRLKEGEKPVYLPLEGGLAESLNESNQANSKMARRRVLVTSHHDLSVRVWEISDNLLIPKSDGPTDSQITLEHKVSWLSQPFPKLLQEFSLRPIVQQISQPNAALPILVNVELTPESLECICVLNNGDVLVSRFDSLSFEYACKFTGTVPHVDGGGHSDADELSAVMKEAMLELEGPSRKHSIFGKRDKDRRQSAEGSEASDGSRRDSLAPVAALALANARRESIKEKEKPLSPPSSPMRPAKSSRRKDAPKLPEQEVLSLAHLNTTHHTDDHHFTTSALIPSDQPVSATAVSDVGFLAIAAGPRLCIVDLSKNAAIYQDVIPGQDFWITQMEWSVIGLGGDGGAAPRLIVVCSNGFLRVLTMHAGVDGWYCSDKVDTQMKNLTSPPIAIFVRDSQCQESPLNALNLQNAIYHRALQPHLDLHSFLIVIGSRYIAVETNITGGRNILIELDKDIVQAKIVDRDGSFILCLFTFDGRLDYYSLPECDRLHMVDASVLPVNAKVRDCQCADDGYYAIAASEQASFGLYSVFPKHVNRLPQIELFDPARQVSAVSTGIETISNALGSWWSGKSYIGGEAMDTFLAGPKRPEKRYRKPARAPRYVPSQEPAQVAGPSKGTAQNQTLAGITASMPSAEALRNALNERGEKLAGLGEAVNDLGRASQEYAAQAKRALMERGFKSKMSSMFS